MVLVVVRHAESIENATKYTGFYQDARPYDGPAAHTVSRDIVGLTPLGFRQSLWLGEHLADLTDNRTAASSKGVLFTSTYRRSIDTAAIAFPALAERTERTALLDEQHYGDATYMTKTELFATYPECVEQRQGAKHLWVPPGGGESLADGVLTRAKAFTELALAAADEGRPVIAVTHHTTILALRALLEQRELTDVVEQARKAKTPNAGVLRYELRDGRTRLVAEQAPPPGL